MGSEATVAIGGVVGALSKFLMMGTDIRGPWITLIAIVVTTFVFVIFGYSHNDFSRESSWQYFMSWVEVLGLAAGAFHGTQEAVRKAIG